MSYLNGNQDGPISLSREQRTASDSHMLLAPNVEIVRGTCCIVLLALGCHHSTSGTQGCGGDRPDGTPSGDRFARARFCATLHPSRNAVRGSMAKRIRAGDRNFHRLSYMWCVRFGFCCRKGVGVAQLDFLVVDEASVGRDKVCFCIAPSNSPRPDFAIVLWQRHE